MNWGPIWLTFKLAAITTLILFFVSIPLSYWLSVTKNRIKPVIETLISMPLVLPPTVIGFYLLISLSPNSLIGGFLERVFGLKLVFSFEGLVFASIIYSLPFMIHPIQSGLSNLPKSLTEAAIVLGKTKQTTLFRILLPNIKSSLLTGVVLSFAHTIGEFGVVLMIGGSIPDQTRVASIAIYDQVEAMNYGLANTYSLILFFITFLVLLLVYMFNGGYMKKFLK